MLFGCLSDSQPPAIANSSEAHIAVEHNEGLTLFCHVNGLPLPTAKWFKVNTIIKYYFINE